MKKSKKANNKPTKRKVTQKQKQQQNVVVNIGTRPAFRNPKQRRVPPPKPVIQTVFKVTPVSQPGFQSIGDRIVERDAMQNRLSSQVQKLEPTLDSARVRAIPNVPALQQEQLGASPARTRAPRDLMKPRDLMNEGWESARDAASPRETIGTLQQEQQRVRNIVRASSMKPESPREAVGVPVPQLSNVTPSRVASPTISSLRRLTPEIATLESNVKGMLKRAAGVKNIRAIVLKRPLIRDKPGYDKYLNVLKAFNATPAGVASIKPYLQSDNADQIAIHAKLFGGSSSQPTLADMAMG